MKKTIYIAVLNQGHVRTELANVLKEISHQTKYNTYIKFWGEKPIANNRNKIVQEFLAYKAFDVLMMVDSDIVPPLNILNLADFQKDIIAPVCFMYQEDMIAPVAFKRKPDGLYLPIEITGEEGLIEVDAVGTGCIFLSRKVLEDVRAPFMNEYDADGIKIFGLDIAFCRRAKEKGYKVFVHLDYLCSHWTTVDLKEIYSTLSDYLDQIYLLKQKLRQNDTKNPPNNMGLDRRV